MKVSINVRLPRLSRKAAALVEFALVLPIVILLVFGIVEFGAMFYDKAVITNASREGARYGVAVRSSSYATSTQIIAYTKNFTTNKILSFGGTPTVNVTITQSASPPTTGTTLKVTVSFVYTNLAVLNLLGLGTSVTISSDTTMTYE